MVVCKQAIFCSECGHKNKIVVNKERNGLKPCEKCGVELAEYMMLLTHAGLSDEDHRICGQCQHADTGNPFCWSCGHQFH